MATSCAPSTARREQEITSETIEWLVDNAAAYDALLQGIARARESIWITQLAFDANCAVLDRGVLLLDALIAASTERGVAVRIILNQTLLLDTATPLRRALRARGATDVPVRGIRRFPQLLHAKMLIVDETEAFLVGSPFVNGYWDDSRHAPIDSRRPHRELGGRPLHDLSARITGPAVRVLGAIFTELWNGVSTGDAEDTRIEGRPPAIDAPDGTIDIVRTAPGVAALRHRRGTTDILAAIEDALGGAQRLVYVEHQYLSSRRVLAALVGALEREVALEVVIVLNQNPDVTAYRSWQNARLREAALLEHPRVGIFTLWRATPADDVSRGWTVNQLFVHSKVLIVDDEWLTVGSANLDGVSLHSYGDDFSGWLGRRLFRDVRNFDVNAIVRRPSSAPDNPVRDLRTRLWSEHLGRPAKSLRLAPPDGWLALWRARAAASVDTLQAAPSHDVGSKQPLSVVLPYSACARPSAQLRDVGIRAAERLDLCFDPDWLEVRFSPNWVRNMFA